MLVSSGAIALGLPTLGLGARPTDIGTLQALAAVGQPLLMEHFATFLGEHGLVGGQVLLTPYDFGHRSQYLHARETMQRLLDLGVVPIVNENDTVADDEIRYGDNDRLAALVSHLIAADVVVLLTDTEGVFTSDPRLDSEASLIEEIVEVDAALESLAGGAGSERGSGGMASKLAAAKIAAWSGVRAVIGPPRHRTSCSRPSTARPSARSCTLVASGCRAASSGSCSRWVRRVASSSTTARARRSATTTARSCPPGSRRSRVRSTPTPRSRS